VTGVDCHVSDVIGLGRVLVVIVLVVVVIILYVECAFLSNVVVHPPN
jgi:hypothetical protein